MYHHQRGATGLRLLGIALLTLGAIGILASAVHGTSNLAGLIGATAGLLLTHLTTSRKEHR